MRVAGKVSVGVVARLRSSRTCSTGSSRPGSPNDQRRRARPLTYRSPSNRCPADLPGHLIIGGRRGTSPWPGRAQPRPPRDRWAGPVLLAYHRRLGGGAAPAAARRPAAARPGGPGRASRVRAHPGARQDHGRCRRHRRRPRLSLSRADAAHAPEVAEPVSQLSYEVVSRRTPRRSARHLEVSPPTSTPRAARALGQRHLVAREAERGRRDRRRPRRPARGCPGGRRRRALAQERSHRRDAYNAQQVVVEGLRRGGVRRGARRRSTSSRGRRAASRSCRSPPRPGATPARAGVPAAAEPADVAVSRAEHTAYVVYGTGLLDDLRTPEGVARLSAFARLVGSAWPGAAETADRRRAPAQFESTCARRRAGSYADFANVWHTPDVFVMDFVSARPSAWGRRGWMPRATPSPSSPRPGGAQRVRIPPQLIVRAAATARQLEFWNGDGPPHRHLMFIWRVLTEASGGRLVAEAPRTLLAAAHPIEER